MIGLRKAIEDAGIMLKDGIPPFDGEWHKYPTSDKPHNKNGRISIYPDKPHNWSVWNYATGFKAKGFLAEAPQAVDTSFIKQKAKSVEPGASSKACACDPFWALAYSYPCEGHFYLSAKGVNACPGLFTDGHTLAVPVLDENGDVHGIQKISPDGDKFFTPGTEKVGHFFPISGSAEDPLLIGEGLATCLSAHEATGYESWVAFDCGNLLKVAQKAHELDPDRKIILLADNDSNTEGNPGLTKAQEAAKDVGGLVAVPPPGDFNDLQHLIGLDEVHRIIQACLDSPKEDRFKGLRMRDLLKKLDEEKPTPILDDVPPGTIIQLTGASGALKTTLADELCAKLATGFDFAPFVETYGIHRVLCYSGEDTAFTLADRIQRVLSSFNPPSEVIELWHKNMIQLPFRGESMVMLRSSNGEFQRTDFVEQMINDIKESQAEFVVMDTLKRITTAKENDNDAGAQIVYALEFVAKETGATIMVLSHTGKPGKEDTLTDKLGQYAARGASAVTDNSRKTYLAYKPNMSDSKPLGLSPDNIKDSVLWATIKSNFGPFPTYEVMHVNDKGIPTHTLKTSFIRHGNDDSKIFALLEFVAKETSEQFTKRKLKDHKHYEDVVDAAIGRRWLLYSFKHGKTSGKGNYLTITDLGREELEKWKLEKWNTENGNIQNAHETNSHAA